jgi:hypothetical protein
LGFPRLTRAAVRAATPALLSEETVISLALLASAEEHPDQLISHPTPPDTIMSTTYVPTISSGIAGPLGVLHLPRLWQKVSLEAQGKLAPGYPGIGKGYDSMVLSALGLDPETVKSYIRENKPSYPQFESWIRQQPNVTLDAGTIQKLNDSIKGYQHDDETRSGIFKNCGYTDQECNYRDAINLNNLDDWHEFHQSVLK